MADEQNRKRIYTTAVPNMDLRGTREIDAKAGVTITGHNVRLVEIPEDLYDKQLIVYITNLYAVLDEDEWRTEQQFGNIKASVGGRAANAG